MLLLCDSRHEVLLDVLLLVVMLLAVMMLLKMLLLPHLNLFQLFMHLPC